MAERDLLLTALMGEVLGPRAGARETLRADEDPLDEYITGVLAPHSAPSVELDADDDLVGDDESVADDQADPGSPISSPTLDLGSLPSPTLDPRSRPASLGISFSLAGELPAIGICCTWARYVQATGGGWTRRPAGEHWQSIICTTNQQFVSTVDNGVRIHLRCRQVAQRWRVSIFLVNSTSCTGRPRTEDHVFQPQIRVRCHEGAQLVPIDEDRVARDQEEENSLSLLYRDRRTLARGHLCSALWRETDPERPHASIPSPNAAPFRWVDGDALFSEAVQRDFSPPEVRSEYLPVVPVNAPDKGWLMELDAPTLDPAVLAETWDAQSLRNALEPLADGYQIWIRAREQTLPELSNDERQSGQRHLDDCNRALSRIRAGINSLISDADARLAFCFANRAMAMQSLWTKGTVNPWWPFQIAFQLVNLPALQHRDHPDREICDLLWFPTGGGKTEAYLGLAAFTMAHRRLTARRVGRADGGAGVAVLSRYTLRLLTIQQFRRALAVVTACEKLRVERIGGLRGWRPKACSDPTDRLWGTTRFSSGLWVGGGVTPNALQDFTYKDRADRIVMVRGALSALEGRGDSEGEPAQILTCPACASTLAVPSEGYQRGEAITLHFVLGDAARALTPPSEVELSVPPFSVVSVSVVAHDDQRFCTLTLGVTFGESARPESIDVWFRDHVKRVMGPNTWLVAARATRPGYFIRSIQWGRSRSAKPIDFEIFCPNPGCDLNNVEWEEETPCGSWPAHAAFASAAGTTTHCPIPAWTVDEQVYQWCPSMVVATVDKFARLAFEPRAASLFGNVERFNEHLGFYRRWCAPLGPSSLPGRPAENPAFGRNVVTAPLVPPDLILQDELHLIEGPLGSMVGLYETAIDALASSSSGARSGRAKYIASTATVRNAASQVQSLFVRRLDVFPPAGISVDDSFFARTGAAHPLDADSPGRLYVGICAPGRGAQTPIVRIWSRLMQHVADRRAAGTPDRDLDNFWTLVGYFNAIRELAGAVALTRQDILQRLTTIGLPPRMPDANEPVELSSRADSMSLPAMLGHLQVQLGGTTPPVNVAVATSMFGTGVDVDRLGLMVVHGQPKTTSSYIQATGRVGRRQGGLVVTFLRASRPRDLNHYEFFSAYHGSLYRFVEPITVNPFAPRARDRGLGPVAVALLRQAVDFVAGAGTVPVHDRWRVQQRFQGGIHCLAHEMARARRDADVGSLPAMLEQRSQAQPGLRRPSAGDTHDHASSELDLWQQLAAQAGSNLVYFESTLINPPSRPVVLGDLAHEIARTGVAYEDAPNSLRDVEATVTIRGWR